MAKQTTQFREVKKNIREYTERLKKDGLPIQKVILFGSWAKGKVHKGSDIDICIISPKFKGKFDAWDYLWQRRMLEDLPLEPYPYHPKDFVDEDPLVWEIKKNGIEIK